jgi:chemotaxis signal transduction protein
MAFPAAHVREVLGQRPWVPVPSTMPHMPGVVAWQGRAIALFDLGTLGGGMRPLQPDQRRHRTLVVQVEGATLAVPVDAVLEVEEVASDRIRPSQVTALKHCAKEVDLRGTPMPLVNLGEAMKLVLSSAA